MSERFSILLPVSEEWAADTAFLHDGVRRMALDTWRSELERESPGALAVGELEANLLVNQFPEITLDDGSVVQGPTHAWQVVGEVNRLPVS